MIKLPEDFRSDESLKAIHPNCKIGDGGYSLEKDDDDFEGLCRYCGVKTSYYKELENGFKQPVCCLICGGLLLEIQDLVQLNSK